MAGRTVQHLLINSTMQGRAGAGKGDRREDCQPTALDSWPRLRAGRRGAVQAQPGDQHSLCTHGTQVQQSCEYGPSVVNHSLAAANSVGRNSAAQATNSQWFNHAVLHRCGQSGLLSRWEMGDEIAHCFCLRVRT